MTDPAATDKKFTDLVAQFVRGVLPHDIESNLLLDSNLDRMYYALISLKKDVEVQLSSQKSRSVKMRHELNQRGDDGTGWKKYQAEEADWRARAIKFLASVEDHLAAIKERRRDRNIQANLTTSQALYEAIVEHSEQIDPDDATEADTALHALVR